MKKKIIVSVLCLALLIFSINIYAEAEGDNKGPNFWLGRTIISQLNNKSSRSYLCQRQRHRDNGNGTERPCSAIDQCRGERKRRSVLGTYS